MMLNTCRTVAVMMSLAVLLSFAASGAAAVPAILLDLPQTGPVGDAVRSAAAHLQLQGYGISWLTEDRPDTNYDIVALGTMSGATLRTQAADDLAQAVREGAGLVYLVSGDRQQVEQDAAFLATLGLQLTHVPRQGGQLRLSRHEVLDGVRRLGGAASPLNIVGPNATALAEYAGDAVAVAATLGRGRIVVLPLDMIGTHAPGQAPLDAEVRLLAQAMHWAAGSIMAQKAYGPGQQPAPPVESGYKKPDKQPLPPLLQQPGEGRTDQPPTGPTEPARTPAPPGPPAPEAISSTVLWDIGGEDDRWPEVGQVVKEVIEEAGLRMREVRFRDDREPEPLVTRMPVTPSLLVIGSYREFSPAEAQQVAAHVRGGGALLAVANATAPYQLRMVFYNRILAEFGLAVRLTRPGGSAVVADLPLTRSVRLDQLPPGISVWGFGDWQLVRVGNEAAASAQLHRNGRVVVLDGTMLVAPDRRVAGEFRQLLANAVEWLTGQQ